MGTYLCHMRNRESHCKQSQESQVSLTAVTRDNPSEIKGPRQQNGIPMGILTPQSKVRRMVVAQLTAMLRHQQNDRHKTKNPSESTSCNPMQVRLQQQTTQHSLRSPATVTTLAIAASNQKAHCDSPTELRINALQCSPSPKAGDVAQWVSSLAGRAPGITWEVTGSSPVSCKCL